MARVNYDHDADVLYVNYLPDRPAHKGIEDPAGVVRRYTENGDLIGVTILDFTHRLLGECNRPDAVAVGHSAVLQSIVSKPL